jgi:hypothetical protein
MSEKKTPKETQKIFTTMAKAMVKGKPKPKSNNIAKKRPKSES